MTMIDTDSKERTGFDIDIANALASDMGVKVVFVPTTWKTLVNGVVADKYDNVDAVHHYEITQESGSTKVKINIGTDNTDYPSATPITNYEYELERQNTISRVRLLDPAYLPQFVTEFETLMKESIL